MSRLVHLYASNLLKADIIKAAGDNLRNFNFSTRGQLPDENLGIGDETWVLPAELESEHDLKPLYSAVRQFYVATIQKMIKKFPFGDSTWGLLILNQVVLILSIP